MFKKTSATGSSGNSSNSTPVTLSQLNGVSLSMLGAPNGIATLSSEAKVPDASCEVPVTLQLPTDHAIGAHRCVMVDMDGNVQYIDSTDADTVNLYIGITTESASAHSQVTVQTRGQMIDESFNFVPGPVYIGLHGQLTQSQPNNARYIQRIGLAVASDHILIQPHSAIITC